MLKVGPNDYILEDNVLHITTDKSVGIRRKIKQYREGNNFHLYDYSYNKTVKSVIITKADEIIITAIPSETLIARYERAMDKKWKRKNEITREVEQENEM